MCCNFNLPDTLSFFMIFPALNTRFCVLILSLNLSCLSGTAFTRTHDWLYFVSRHACMHAYIHAYILTYDTYIHTYIREGGRPSREMARHCGCFSSPSQSIRVRLAACGFFEGIESVCLLFYLSFYLSECLSGLRLVVSLKVLILVVCLSVCLLVCQGVSVSEGLLIFLK